MRSMLCAVMLFVSLGSSAAGQIPSDEQLAAISTAEQIGVALFEKDQAAWHATDLLLAQLGDKGLQGVIGCASDQLPHVLSVGAASSRESRVES